VASAGTAAGQIAAQSWQVIDFQAKLTHFGPECSSATDPRVKASGPVRRHDDSACGAVRVGQYWMKKVEQFSVRFNTRPRWPDLTKTSSGEAGAVHLLHELDEYGTHEIWP
jgi:hypothetical protein